MKPGNRRKHGANSSGEICEDEEEKYKHTPSLWLEFFVFVDVYFANTAYPLLIIIIKVLKAILI